MGVIPSYLDTSFSWPPKAVTVLMDPITSSATLPAFAYAFRPCVVSEDPNCEIQVMIDWFNICLLLKAILKDCSHVKMLCHNSRYINHELNYKYHCPELVLSNNIFLTLHTLAITAPEAIISGLTAKMTSVSNQPYTNPMIKPAINPLKYWNTMLSLSPIPDSILVTSLEDIYRNISYQ